MFRRRWEELFKSDGGGKQPNGISHGDKRQEEPPLKPALMTNAHMVAQLSKCLLTPAARNNNAELA